EREKNECRRSIRPSPPLFPSPVGRFPADLLSTPPSLSWRFPADLPFPLLPWPFLLSFPPTPLDVPMWRGRCADLADSPSFSRAGVVIAVGVRHSRQRHRIPHHHHRHLPDAAVPVRPSLPISRRFYTF